MSSCVCLRFEKDVPLCVDVRRFTENLEFGYGVDVFTGFCSGFCSVVLVRRLPLNPPPLVPIPPVGLSAPSCPHLCPRYLGHRCGHVVADKPAEDSAAEGKASSKLVVTMGGHYRCRRCFLCFAGACVVVFSSI